MIPEFPTFKKIELTDRAKIIHVTKNFPPYSDFNFESMWSWDTHENVRISKLNGNLAVKFTDYLNNKSFYSFIGTRSVSDTARRLIDLSVKEGLGRVLHLIPQDCIGSLDTNVFDVREDRNNFDYIIPVEILTKYNTPKTKSRKKAVDKFLANHPNHRVKYLDLTNPETTGEIFTFFNTVHDMPKKAESNELLALTRFIKNARRLNHFALGVYIDKKLRAFSISEIQNDSFAVGHFLKSDVKHCKNLYAYLIQQVASYIKKLHCKYLNIEQDMGIESLRAWKESYGSDFFLKKYSVSLRKNSK